MKEICFFLGWVVLMLLSSCSSDDYVDAVPGESIAVISVDSKALLTQTNKNDSENLVQQLLGVDALSDIGVDLQSPVYLFETPDGTLGLCAKVDDDDLLDDFINQTLVKRGECPPTSVHKDCNFTILKKSWILGFSSKSLLLMGPVSDMEQSKMQQLMARYLDADEENGIRSSRLFSKLDSIEAPIKLVARGQSLPEALLTPLSLGLPKDVDASRLVLAAGISVQNKVAIIDGNTFSFNENINRAMTDARKQFRPITPAFVANVAQTDLGAVLLNMKGKALLDMIRANKGLQTLLAGINTAIDMDNILRSIDGDALLLLRENKKKMALTAKLADTNWLKDVDYWMKSTPSGSKIERQGNGTFRLIQSSQSPNDAFYFGVSDDKKFWSGTGRDVQQVLQISRLPVSSQIQNIIKGKRLALILHLNPLKTELGADMAAMLQRWMNPLLGDINTIIYIQQ